MPFVLPVLFAYANNLSLLVQKILLRQTLLDCDCASNAIYRTKKAPIQVLLGFGSALLTQRFFVRLCKRLLCKSFLNCNSTSNAIYRTKKAPIQVLLGFGSALLTQRFFVRLCKRLLCKSFLNCNCASNACTNHRVVAHTDKTHHFDVCGNG